MTTDPNPALSGMVAIVAGTEAAILVEVAAAFADHRMPVAVVAPQREVTVTVSAQFADAALGLLAVTGDPADPALWQRVLPHTEQRLGPIDVVVLAGDAVVRDLVVDLVVPDMTARRRGVVIELGADVVSRVLPCGVHHYHAESVPEVLAAAVAPDL